MSSTMTICWTDKLHQSNEKKNILVNDSWQTQHNYVVGIAVWNYTSSSESNNLTLNRLYNMQVWWVWPFEQCWLGSNLLSDAARWLVTGRFGVWSQVGTATFCTDFYFVICSTACVTTVAWRVGGWVGGGLKRRKKEKEKKGGGGTFCQKCRWQVTDTRGTVKLKWADHCPRILRTHQENKVEQFLSSAKSSWPLLGDTVLKWSQHVEPACKMDPPQPHHPHHIFFFFF